MGLNKKKKQDARPSLREQIKQMEAERREKTAVEPKADKTVSFDSWYHQRKQKIPKQHMKEILSADFKSRGLGDKATMAEYDKALKLYGVKL
jgi:hypothetical protein